MEKFLSLSAEKQKIIIDAAFLSFGANGYKKTSISDIASAAGISKAMVFHYFGTKRAMYFYLIDLSLHILMSEINEKFDPGVNDFFDRIKLSTHIEISVTKKHPSILSFINSVYFEHDDEVEADVKTALANSEVTKLRSKIAFEGMDASKFKDGIDPKLVLKILTYFVEGYLSKFPGKPAADLDALYKEFDECIHLFKTNFYKDND